MEEWKEVVDEDEEEDDKKAVKKRCRLQYLSSFKTPRLF